MHIASQNLLGDPASDWIRSQVFSRRSISGAVADALSLIQAQSLTQHLARRDVVQSGTNITIAWNALGPVISATATAPDDATAVLANREFSAPPSFGGSVLDFLIGIAFGTHNATSKATPVDADELPLVDSAASNVLKKLTWANLKATLKTYLDTLYTAIALTLRATGAVSLSNSSTGAQSIFGSTITVVSGQAYKLEATIRITNGNTTHTNAFGFGGGATWTSVDYDAVVTRANAGAINTGINNVWVTAATATVLDNTSTAQGVTLRLSGTVVCNAGGTVDPQITFSAGPTGTCQTERGSRFSLTPIA